jgi:hypothetical protein
MSDLIAGFSASSSYSSLASATSYSNPYRGVSHSTASLTQEASFSFDAVIAESHSNPISSLPFAEGEKDADDVISQLAEKLAGFLEPFGYKGEKLAEVINTAMESLADLVEDTSVDAAALSIDIRLARVEESYSNGRFGSAGVFSGFALEVNVSTTTVDYDPGRAVVINTAGSKVEFSQTQMIEGHKHGVFRRESPSLSDFKGYNKELAEQTKEIVEFLKETRKQLKAFTREEEHGYRHYLKNAMKDFSHHRMRA